MATPLLDGLAAALGGYDKGVDRTVERQRQARIDAQNQQVFQEQQDERQRIKTERQSLIDAAKPATMTEGAGGMLRPETMDNRDVGLPDSQGLQKGGYGVAGKSFADKAQADKALTAYNDPEAANNRVAQALRTQGRPDQALQYESAAQKSQSDKRAAIRDVFNDDFADLSRAKGVMQAAAETMTKTNGMGLKGLTMTATVTPDGKNVEFHQTGPDGKRELKQTLPNTPESELHVMRSVLQVSGDKLVSWHADRVAQAAALRKETQANEIAGRKADNEEAKTDEQARRNDYLMVGGGLGGRGGVGGAGGVGGNAASAKAAATESVMGRIHSAIDKDQNLTPGQRLSAGSYATNILKVPGLSLSEADAARVSVLAATEPKSVTSEFNIRTGTVDSMVRLPEVASGMGIPIASSVAKPADFFKGKEQKDVHAKLNEMLLDMAGNNSEMAMRWAAIARDPAQAKAAVADALATKGPAYASNLSGKLELLSRLPAPAAKNPAKTDAIAPAGGINRPSAVSSVDYQPRPGVPEALAQRTQMAADQSRASAEKKAAEQAAKAGTQAQSRSDKTAAISWLTTAEIAQMTQTEAIKIYNQYANVLAPDVEAALSKRTLSR